MARLRLIDVDRDPAAFISLRQAYEECLDGEEPQDPMLFEDRGEAAVEAVVDGAGTAIEARPAAPSSSAAPPDLQILHGEATAFAVAFRAALEAGRFQPLAELYDGGLARAYIPMGRERALLEQVLDAAASDPEVSTATMLSFAAGHGWQPFPGLDAEGAGERLLARLDAEDWLQDQIAQSGRGIPYLWPQPARVARVLLGLLSPWRLLVADVAPMRVVLEEWRRYGPYLGDRFDEERAGRLDRHIRFLSRPWMRAIYLDFSVEAALVTVPIYVLTLVFVVVFAYLFAELGVHNLMRLFLSAG